MRLHTTKSYQRYSSWIAPFLTLSVALLFQTISTAQSTSFTFTHYSNNPMTIWGVAEMEDGYIMVGERTPTDENLPCPYFLKIDGAGNFTGDSVLSGFPGYFSNIFNWGDNFVVSGSASSLEFPEDVESVIYQIDENFQMLSPVGVQWGKIQNCKMIDNTTLIAIGTEQLDENTYLANAKLYNLTEFLNEDYYTLLFQSVYPIEMYDVVKIGNTYRIFVKNQLIENATGVKMFTYDANFEFISVSDVETGYSDFGIDSKFTGPVSALLLSDTTFMIHGVAPHPLSANEENNLDAATAVWNEANEELELTFTGVADTNAYTSRNSISRGNGHIYLGATKNFDGLPSDATSYFMLTKLGDFGDVVWTKYYGNDTNLKLTNVLATADGGALMVGESYIASVDVHNIYVVKVGPNGELTGIDNPDPSTFSTYVFPNPATSQIKFELPDGHTGAAILEIFDLSGKKLDVISFRPGMAVNVAQYENGIYIYRLLGDGFQSSGKFVVGR